MGEAISLAITTDGFLLLAIGSILAGLVRGFSGFGTAMVYLPFAAQVFDPVWVLITLFFLDLFGPIPAIPGALRHGQFRDVLLLGAGALVGAPAGLAILLAMQPSTFRYAIAATTAVLLAILISGFRFRGRLTRKLVFGTGALAGMTAGSVGLPGPPVILLYMASALPVATIRANIFLFLLLLDTFMIVLFFANDLMEVEPIVIGLCLLPLYVAAAAIGVVIFDPEREAVYRWAAYMIIAGSAICGLPAWDAI